MNSTATAIATVTPRHDKNDTQNLGVPRPKSGWQLSDRLAWAMGLKVKPSSKLVAVAIASHAGATSGLAWPSLSTLSAETGLSRRQIVYSVRDLERGGHLTITRLRVGKANRANRYRIPQLAGSANPGGGSATSALGGSAQVAPEPVRRTEPVNVHTARARVSCERHDRTWYESDGQHCHECARERAKPKDHRRAIPASVLRQHAARRRAT